MKWWLGVAGAVVGLLAGVGFLAVLFTVAPSGPGLFELMILLTVVGMLAVGGAVAWFFLGLLIEHGSHKRQ